MHWYVVTPIIMFLGTMIIITYWYVKGAFNLGQVITAALGAFILCIAWPVYAVILLLLLFGAARKFFSDEEIPTTEESTAQLKEAATIITLLGVLTTDQIAELAEALSENKTYTAVVTDGERTGTYVIANKENGVGFRLVSEEIT